MEHEIISQAIDLLEVSNYTPEELAQYEEWCDMVYGQKCESSNAPQTDNLPSKE